MAKLDKYPLWKDDSAKYFSENTSKVVKSEGPKHLVIVVGGNHAEIHPLEPIDQNGETWQNTSSGKMILRGDFSENTCKVVKSEGPEPLVIVAGGNPAEIYPLEPIAQNGDTW